VNNAKRAELGEEAVVSGTPDFPLDYPTEDAADAIANILHWLEREGGDTEKALERARENFAAERREDV